MDQKALYELACELAEAKQDENSAKSKRISIEERIAALVETADNGSKTVDTGGGLKVTVKRALSYKADVEAIRNLSIPEEMMPVKLTPPKPPEYVFDQVSYENVIANHPDVAAKLADCVTVKPAKVSVALKVA